jgi:hypothetical protein
LCPAGWADGDGSWPEKGWEIEKIEKINKKVKKIIFLVVLPSKKWYNMRVHT